MTKKILSKIYYLGLWGILVAPAVVKAWVPGKSIVPACENNICNFDDLITLIDNLLDVFIWLTIPISTILFALIGWTFIVESDKASARSEAKRKLMTLMKGVFLVLGSWLIVKVILSGLGANDTYNQFIK